MNTPPTLREAQATFLRELHGMNKSQATITAYTTDLHQFLSWLEETNCVISSPIQVTKTDITEFLAHLAEKHITRITRARKVNSATLLCRTLILGCQHQSCGLPPRAAFRP